MSELNPDTIGKRLFLMQIAAGLGPIADLSFEIDERLFTKDIEHFQNNWKQYNPRKGIARQGLSITSLDGGLSGQPDLDSLVEYNRLNGTHYDEPDFRKPTPVFSSLSSLRPVLDLFAPDLGRSHLIRFGRGGHFPPHRDAFGFAVSSFRILGLCQNCRRDQFVMMMGDQRVLLESGHLYFVDTRMDHSVFSFVDDCTILVLNVEITERSVAALMSAVRIR